jgi:fructosamine-3-kinase
MTIEDSISKIIPRDESVQTIDPLEGGFSNDIWRITTNGRCYIFRAPKKKGVPSHFEKVLEIYKKASEQGLGPKVIGDNLSEQQMLLEYIEHIPWPSYQVDATPYEETMRVLRCFHQIMRPERVTAPDRIYAPFDSIFGSKSLLETSDLPTQFAEALSKTEQIYKILEPWLKANATLSHGDFGKHNVLLSKTKGPLLIDFDSSSIGDPFFDVAKFSVSLPKKDRLELLSSYLGQQPTPEETTHLELMEMALLMVVVIVRFKRAQKSTGDRLSKNEMEQLLHSDTPLPSFLEIPFGDSSPQARQKGAIYALAEFLRRSNAINLMTCLKFQFSKHVYYER